MQFLRSSPLNHCPSNFTNNRPIKYIIYSSTVLVSEKRRNRSENKTNSSTEILDSQNLRGKWSKLYRKSEQTWTVQKLNSFTRAGRERGRDGGEMKQSKGWIAADQTPKIKTLLHRYVKLMNVVNAKAKDNLQTWKLTGLHALPLNP